MNERRDDELRLSRRRFLARGGTLGALASVGGFSMLAAACGDDDDSGTASGTTSPATDSTTGGSSASGEPIRIGILLPTEGPYAPIGGMQTKGIELALGGEIAGRPVEFVSIEEPIFSPQDTIQRIQGAVSGDKIHALLGIVSGASALAARDTVHDAKLPLVVTNAVTRAITGSRKSPYLFRASTTGYQAGINFAPWLYENMGKTMVTAAPDYASGHELVDYPKRFFEKAGGKVEKQWWPALGSSDYGAVLTEMGSADADLAYCFFAGAEAVRFVTQFDEFELHDKLKLTGLTLVDDLTLEAQQESAEGIVLLGGWHRRLENPENVQFMEDFETEFGELPNSYAATGYTGGIALRTAIEELGGDIENVDALVAALEEVSFTTPSGSSFTFDPETHNAISDQTVQRVERLDSGDLGFVEIDKLGEAVDPGDDVEP